MGVELKKLLKQGNKCFYCGQRTGYYENAPWLRPTVDHFVPLSLLRKKDAPCVAKPNPNNWYGFNLMTNLVLACFACNNAKGSQDPVDFFMFCVARAIGNPNFAETAGYRFPRRKPVNENKEPANR